MTPNLPIQLRGMTWDHPRAYLPLEAFNGTDAVPTVAWDRQPLADFEARPLETLAPEYDLLVVDHPGLGHAVASGAIVPWDEVVEGEQLTSWAGSAVGPTWSSYHLDGAQWAVPIDAATQVSLAAAQQAGPLPASWREVVDVASSMPTALCLGGPHAFLTLLAMCADDRARPADHLVDPEVAVPALDLLRAVWRHVDREVSLGDPIHVHEAIASGTVDYCPLAYGYASYARPRPGARALRWADAPRQATELPGSVLGGTGLAVSSRRGTDLHAVRTWATGYLTTAVQTGLVPANGGQPAHRAAWDSTTVDRAWGGYYSATRASVETAWTRPRYDGWVGLQDEGSRLVREVVEGHARPDTVVTEINAAHARRSQAGTTTAGVGG